MAWTRSDSILNRNEGIQTLGASVSNKLISQPHNVVTGRGALHSRFDIYIGSATITSGATIQLQTGSGYNLWENVKADTSITSKSATTFTVDTATNIVTATAHGLSNGDVVTVSSTGTLPSGLQANTKYFVEVIDANSIYLHSTAQLILSTRVQFSTTGSGTHSLVKVSKISIRLSTDNVADQAVLPLSNQVRLLASTGAGDSLQIVDIIHVQAD